MMLDPQIARAGLRIGFLVLLLALGVLPFLTPSSVEFVASLLAATMALLFIVGVAALLRRSTSGATGPPSGGPKSQALASHSRAGRDAQRGTDR
jgi:cobalamin synthase